jgi:hypothetical protein
MPSSVDHGTQDTAGGGWYSSSFWFLPLTFSTFLFSYVSLRLKKSDLKAGCGRSFFFLFPSSSDHRSLGLPRLDRDLIDDVMIDDR